MVQVVVLAKHGDKKIERLGFQWCKKHQRYEKRVGTPETLRFVKTRAVKTGKQYRVKGKFTRAVLRKHGLLRRRSHRYW